MIEKEVENYLKKEVEKRGGICVKLDATTSRGLPDRMCILPYGQVLFVETKRPKKGRLSKCQAYILEKINSLGGKAYVVSSKEDIDYLLSRHDKKIYHFEEARIGDI